MRKIIFVIIVIFCFVFLVNNKPYSQNESLHKLFDNYYEDRLKLFPLEATANGDNRYNDLLPNIGSEAYISQVNSFYDKCLFALKAFKRQDLTISDCTYDLPEYMLQMAKEGTSYHPEYMPATQFNSLALTMGILGAGNNQQPFKTVNDYENWLKRMTAFTIWADTVVENFNKGIKAGLVLPKAMVLKMIPQLEIIAEGIRFVENVGLHTGKMTREEAIKYMLDNMPITEQFATSEIERYMANPGQALSYMTGRLKIEELRINTKSN